VDEGYTNVSLGFNFAYFAKIYADISISSNGYVCLGSVEACNKLSRPSPYDTLVGLNYDLNPSRDDSGKIYYKSLSLYSDEFKFVNVHVNLLDPQYFSTNIFMITYDDVLTTDTSSLSIASFQIFLTANSIKSYVLFKFKSCLTDLYLRTASGLTHNNTGFLKEVRIPDGQQCTSSNVGQTGVWVSEVTSSLSGIN